MDPVWFVTTGHPKSGTTWFEALVFSLPGVCGYDPAVTTWRTPRYQPIMGSEEVRAAMAETGTGPADLIRALILPGSVPPPFAALGASRSYAVAEAIALCMKQTNIFGFDQEDGVVEIEAIQHAIAGVGRAPIDDMPSPLACGCPAKHSTVEEILEQLPEFKILQVLRDPRDVIVSFFYHDMHHCDHRRMPRYAEIDETARTIRPYEDWRERIAEFRRRNLFWYYSRARLDDRTLEAVVLRTRYEDQLLDGVGELTRIARFLGLPANDAAIEHVVETYSIDAINQRTNGHRDIKIRKGEAGDWRNHFDREFVGIMGERFCDLIVTLGYEPDHSWIDDLPERRPDGFDFAHFNLAMSTADWFRPLWRADRELQRRYPDPQRLDGDDTFLHWILASPDPEIRRWVGELISLADRWGAPNNLPEPIRTTA